MLPGSDYRQFSRFTTRSNHGFCIIILLHSGLFNYLIIYIIFTIFRRNFDYVIC
jgi:hypothetical protein